MTQDVFKGAWKQLKGNVKKQWGKLTDDDLMAIDGNKDILIGKLQERYGYSKTEAQRHVDTFITTNSPDRP
jgi:uncharacterized protein YjbJ (UPF0337 family)